MLTTYPGNVDDPLHEGPSETSKDLLAISADADGAPILPDVTKNDPHLARDVQTMLTHYMRAHISMCYSHHQKAIHNTVCHRTCDWEYKDDNSLGKSVKESFILHKGGMLPC
jgi:hypothetical protein